MTDHTIVIEGLTRFDVGDDVLVFLQGDASAPALFEVINDQGAHRVVNGVLETTDRQDPLIRALEGGDLDTIADEVRAAVGG